MAVLESIVLENFQSLRERVEIPLRPLTFLYGPNSAGKSAVHDALSLFDALLRGPLHDLRPLIDRWQHQASDAGITPPIRLALNVAEVSLTSFRHAKTWDAVNFIVRDDVVNSIFSYSWPIVGRLTFRVELDKQHEVSEISALAVDFDGRTVLQWKPQFADDYQPLLVLDPDAFGGKLQVFADDRGIDVDRKEAFSCVCFMRTSPLRFFLVEEDLEIRDYHLGLTNIANYLLDCVTSIFSLPTLVAADRGVILDSELMTTGHANTDWRFNQIVALGLPTGFTSGPQGATEKRAKESASTIDQMALSRLKQELRKKATAIGARLDLIQELVAAESNNDASSLIKFAPMGEALNDFANRCLRSHLFIDQGYQIHFDLCEILPAPDSPATTDGTTIWSGSLNDEAATAGRKIGFAAIIFTSLIDKTSRRLTFADVGTGISCVLPVLAAVHSRYSFMQQPELHLHPALQSALGDICIEAVNAGPALHILETHSEYILLRCLKRIRQTTYGRQPGESPLRLKPEQIVVLYFDPQPDGSTKVKRIRVTDDGDFMDRWPRGFFEERGKDLFDE